MATVTTLVASTVYTMVSRDRAYLSDLAQQSRIARRNAREADYARDRLGDPAPGRHRERHHGRRPRRHRHLLLRRGRADARLPGRRGRRVRSIADFIDPAQIDERRQTIDSMRTALEPVDAETAAEVPWTATRKDGEQRRCVVRVRALPVPTPDPGLDDDGRGRSTTSARTRPAPGGRRRRLRRPAGPAHRGLRRGRHRRDRAGGAGGRPRAALRHSEGGHPVADRAEQPPRGADPDEGRRRGDRLPRAAHPDHLHPGLRRAAPRRHRRTSPRARCACSRPSSATPSSCSGWPRTC